MPAALVASVAVILIPALVQWAASRYVNTAVHVLLTDSGSSATAVSQLKAAFWCGDECFYELVVAYYKAYEDPARQQYLANLYHDLTGGDLRTKIDSYSD